MRDYARAAVRALEAYTPPLEGRRGKIRLDFNENTLGFSQHFPELEPDELTAYPEYEEVLQQLAQFLGLPSDHLLLTNGSDEGLFVSAFTFIEPSQDTALIAAPTFALIPHYLRLCQAQIREVLVHDDLSANLDGLEVVLGEGVKLVMLASPDNPTGAVIPLTRLRSWLERFPQTVFVLDEAYHEYAGQTALPLILEFPNLVVSRTFSKAWGLAGLRLGLLAAQPRMIEWMRRVRSPYSVNAVAAKALARFLPRAAELVAEQARQLLTCKASTLDQVRRLGYRVTAGAGNFFLLWAGLTSKALSQFLRDQGILVRDRSSLAKMAGSVRVSLGTASEMAHFLQGVAEFGRRFALIFDLDDTLVDTSQSFDWCVRQLSGCSQAELLALRAEGGFNDDWEATAELLRRRGQPRPLAEVVARGQELYLQCAPESEKPWFEPSQLQALQARHRLLIYTGRTQAEYEPIWGSRLAPYFEEVLCRSPERAPKPDPAGLLWLQEKYQLQGGIYIGNSVDDMAAAKAAGLWALGITTNQSSQALRQAGADWVVENLQQVLQLLLLEEP